MDLKIKDVAELLNVSETTIRRWVADGKIPAYRLNHQYRFSRTEIEDWVMANRLGEETPSLSFAGLDHDNQQPTEVVTSGTNHYSLYRAIHRGGVYTNISGDTKEEIIKATTKQIAKRLNLDAEVLADMLLDRERLMPTALNCGIAVPHTRDFLLKEHFDLIVAVFPKKPIEYGALDGQPVHSMFFLLASDDKRHLHLLAKLAHLSSNKEAVDILKSRPSTKSLLDFIKQWETQSLHSKKEALVR